HVRSIEPQTFPRGLELLLGQDVRTAAFAGDRRQRIAGQHAHRDEDEHGDAEDRRDRDDQASSQVLAHGFAAVLLRDRARVTYAGACTVVNRPARKGENASDLQAIARCVRALLGADWNGQHLQRRTSETVHQHPRDRKRLTEPDYWDVIHRAGRASKPPAPRTERGAAAPVQQGLKRRVKRVLGVRLLDRFRNYEDFLLWDVILPRYLPRREGAKVVEIGCAPGYRLVRLKERFGLTPYG